MMRWIPYLLVLIPALLVVLELAARLFLRLLPVYRVFPPNLQIDQHIDTTVLPRLKPLARVRMNSQGERADEPPPAGGRGTYRVLVIGGSTVECWLLDQDDTWPARIQQLLAAPENLKHLEADRVHVVNIGKSGINAEALDFVFEKTLPGYGRLDAIVILLGIANIVHWIRDGAPPQPEYAVPDLDSFFAWHPYRRYRWTPRATALMEIARRARDLWFSKLETRNGVGKSLKRVRQMRAAATVVRDDIPDTTGVLANFERAMRSALRRAQAGADRVIVIRQPWFEKEHFSAAEEAQLWNGGVGDAYHEEVTTYFSNPALFKMFRRMDERLVSVCTELKIEHIDVMSLLEPSVRSYYDHIHFTPEAADRVAECVVGEILGKTGSRQQAAKSSTGS